MIYVGSYNHHLYAFHADGRVAWKFKTDKFVFASPTICPDGRLLFGSDDGTLYCLQTDSPGLAPSPWPKLQANLGNTGRLTPAVASGE